jgi:hypothetical protein
VRSPLGFLEPSGQLGLWPQVSPQHCDSSHQQFLPHVWLVEWGTLKSGILMTHSQWCSVSLSLQGSEALCILHNMASGHALMLAMNPVSLVLPKYPNALEKAVPMHCGRSWKGEVVTTLWVVMVICPHC